MYNPNPNAAIAPIPNPPNNPSNPDPLPKASNLLCIS